MKNVIMTILAMAVGTIMFGLGIVFMGLEVEPAGMQWLWNLASTSLAVAGMVVFFAPVPLFVASTMEPKR